MTEALKALRTLPGEERPSFLLMQPFTPRGRPNMVSFMVAKSGPLEEYGRIIEYGLPSDSQIDGPGQVGNFVNQDPEISAEFTLLGQGGSRVIQGNMLVIPIEQSLLYVQPIYISANDEASSTGIPEFKRVVVSFNGQIEMRNSLSDRNDRGAGGRAAGPGRSGLHGGRRGDAERRSRDLGAEDRGSSGCGRGSNSHSDGGGRSTCGATARRPS